MENYLLLRIGHSVPAVLLLLAVLAHIIIVWRATTKEPGVLAQKLRRTRNISLPAFALLAVSLPISGWWMTHLTGLPLSQKWLMISIALLPLVFVFGGLLYGSLGRWQIQLAQQQSASTQQKIFALLWAVLLLLVLLATSAVMGAKPL